jgi:hypothetical protein
MNESRTAEFSDHAHQDLPTWDLAVRGYDNPELAREDVLMRKRFSEGEGDVH